MRKRNAPEPAPVVPLEGNSFRDQDWQAIRDLAGEAPVKKPRRRRKGKKRRVSSSSSRSVGNARVSPLESAGLSTGLSSDEQSSGKSPLPEFSAVLKQLAQKVSAPSPISGVPTWQLYAGGVLTLLLLVGVGRILLNSSDGAAPTSGGESPVPAAAAALDIGEPEEEPIAVTEAVQEQPLPDVSMIPPEVVAAGFDGATIQVGAFRDRANAERLVEVLREKHEQVQVQQLDNDLYRVTIGPFIKRETADGIAQEIQSEMQLSTLVVTAPLVHVRVAAQ